MARRDISIKEMQSDDVHKLASAYIGSGERNIGFENYISRCYEENLSKERITFIAFDNEEVAGYVNIIYKSYYPYFVEKNIPEINDLSVLSHYRKRGIGRRLISRCEEFAAVNYDYIGLGVGLYKDYGSAQRLYTKNGYVFDCNGLMYRNEEVKPGNHIFVDDDLLLYLYKKIRQGN